MRRRCDMKEFRVYRDPRCGTGVFDDGDFVASCPCCLRRRQWHLSDAVPARVRRRFPGALRERFCEAVARGIPLALPGPASYLGPVRRLREGEQVPTSDSGNRLDLVPHLFREHATGRKRLVFLPRDAALYCGRGRELEAGEVFAVALTREVPARWLGLNAAGRWGVLPDLCGSGMFEFLLKPWFDHQALRLSYCPEQLLFPVELVALAAAAAEPAGPAGLWWDFHRSGDLNLIDPQLGERYSRRCGCGGGTGWPLPCRWRWH